MARAGAGAASDPRGGPAGLRIPVPRPPRRGSRDRAGGCCDSLVAGSSKKSNSMSSSRGSTGELDHPSRPERKCTRGTVETQGVRTCPRAGAHPGPVPADPPPRLRRDGPRLARPRRAERPRRRAEDRRPGGQGGHRAEREARAASSLRHPRCQRIFALARDPCHVYIAYEYVPGRTMREALRAGELDDQRGARGVRRRSRTRSPTPTAAGSSTATSSRRTCCSPSRREIDVRLLDFGLAQMAEFDTLTALGDIPGHARLHLARAAARAPRDRRPPTCGRSASCSGRRSPASIRSSAATLPRPRRRIQHGAPAARDAFAPTCRATSSRRSTAPSSRARKRRPTAERLADELRAACRGGARKPGRRAHRRRRRSRCRRSRAIGSSPARSRGSPRAGSRRRCPSTRRAGRSGSQPWPPALGFASPRAGLALRARDRRSSRSRTSRSGSPWSTPRSRSAGSALNWRDAATRAPARRRAAALAARRARAAAARRAARARARAARAAGRGRRPARGRRRGDPPRPAPVRRLDAAARPRSRRLDTADRRRRRALAAARRAPGDHSPRRSSSRRPPSHSRTPVDADRGRAVLFAGALLTLTATIAPAAALLPLVAAAWLTRRGAGPSQRARHKA